MIRARDWLAQAERDLEHAKWSAERGHHAWACFAAQQSGEKAVKAALNALGREARGHGIRAPSGNTCGSWSTAMA